MSDLILGRQPVLEALKAGQSIEKIFIQHGSHGTVIDNIYKLSRERGIPISEATKDRLKDLAKDKSTQGVVALSSATNYAGLEDILALAREKNEPLFVLLLDEIEDPHNLGALIRTAECAGIHGVVIPRHHAAGVNETVMKTSAGAVVHVLIARVANMQQAIQELQAAGAWIVGAEMEAPKAYYEIDFKGPIGIVIGSEGKGIRRLVKEKCDFLVKIPVFGKMQSLNASVAGGVLMFEVARQRKSVSS